MRARLKDSNTLIPPKDAAEGLRRRRSLNKEIGRIQSQLNACERDFVKYRPSAYKVWHERASIALLKFKQELVLLNEWLVEQQQMLLKSCLDLVVDFEPDELSEDERKLVEKLSLIFK